jgi:predicted phosphodiesterase
LSKQRAAAKKPAPRKEGRALCVAILSDMHFPDCNPAFWRAALLLLKDVQPDEVVLNGDFGEWSSGSAHTPDAFKAAYEDDVRANRAALNQLRATCPRARLTWLEGNHENSVARSLAGCMPSMVRGYWERWRRDLGLDDLDVDWVPEMAQPLKRGHLRVLHGHQVPGKLLPKHHAAKMADLYGAPNLLIAFGHSHRPGMYLRPSKEGNCRAFALSCGRTLDPAWMKGGVGGWQNGLALAYVRPGGAADLYPVDFTQGALVWAGRTYR